MNRQEHLEWCKKRALEYVEVNDLSQAFASMASDLKKHPETEKHSAINLGMMMKLAKLVIVKAKTKKECENYFKMISANDDVEVYDIDYMRMEKPKLSEAKYT